MFYIKNPLQKLDPLQAGLVFVLAIAIPFLLALVILYARWPSWSTSERCDRFCCYMKASFEAVHVNESKEAEKIIAKREVSFHDYSCGSHGEVAEFPYIGYLLESLYFDDIETEHKFVCSVIILSAKWALTTTKCMAHKDINNLSIRTASNYWSKEGTKRIVRRLQFSVPQNGLVAIRFQRELFACSRPVKLSPNMNYLDRTIVKGFGFNMNGHLEPALKQRFKFKKIDMVYINLRDCNGDESLVQCKTHQMRCIDGSFSSPLVNFHGELLGFVDEVSCSEKRARFRRIEPYMSWIGSILREDSFH